MADRNFRVRRRGKESVLAVGSEQEDGTVEIICGGTWRRVASFEAVLPDLENLSTTGVEVEWVDG